MSEPDRHQPEQALKELEGQISAPWCDVLEQVRQVVKILPATGRATLFELYERLPAERKPEEHASPLNRLRQVVLRLSEEWETYCLHQKRADVPATNNRTEQAIGRWRTRSRDVRGLKLGGAEFGI